MIYFVDMPKFAFTKVAPTIESLDDRNILEGVEQLFLHEDSKNPEESISNLDSTDEISAGAEYLSDSVRDVSRFFDYHMCVTRGASYVSMHLSVEIPFLSHMTDWVSLYSNVFSFINGNCAHVNVTRIVFRITLPVFPLNESGPWWPPNSCPMFTQLIEKLQSGLELFINPSLTEEYNREMWAQFSPRGSDSAIEGVYEFLNEWNAFLNSSGVNTKFNGIIFDDPNMLEYAELKSMKVKYASIKTATWVVTDMAELDEIYIPEGSLYSAEHNVILTTKWETWTATSFNEYIRKLPAVTIAQFSSVPNNWFKRT